MLFVAAAVFNNTTLSEPTAVAITLVVGTLTWIAAQTRAHMKSKILYVEPDSGTKPEKTGHSS